VWGAPAVTRTGNEAQANFGHNGRMTGIQFVTDDKGRKVAVLIDLKKHGARRGF